MSRASVRQIGMQVVPQNLFELWAVFTRPVDQNGLGFSPEQQIAYWDVSRPPSFVFPNQIRSTTNGAGWSPRRCIGQEGP